MCGIVGISSRRPVGADIYNSLIQLQHRGQDAAGIMTCDERFHIHKGSGLVRDIFTPDVMSRLTGDRGIGHTRYPTSGVLAPEEIQPLWTNVPYGIGLVHNGNVVNYPRLKREIIDRRHRYLNTQSDSEALLHLFADSLNQQQSFSSLDEERFFTHICRAVEDMFLLVKGAVSALGLIIGRGLFAFRDPHGIRPLAIGTRENGDGTTDYIFASETAMFYMAGFKYWRDVSPGEVIYVTEDGEFHSRLLPKKVFSPCVFEYVYFARPDTWMNNVSVYRSRLRMGQNLAKHWMEKYPDVKPDVIVPAPSTANVSAHAMAETLGIRYSEALYKNAFIGRTFIMPDQAMRETSVRYKLVPMELEIKGKDIMIVDDSIVRGTTSREIVRMLKEFGAKKVYFVSACPPVKFPCYYGLDIPTKEELIANDLDESTLCDYLEADILLYQTIEDLVEAVTRKGDHGIDRPCMACLDGCYVSGGEKEAKGEA